MRNRFCPRSLSPRVSNLLSSERFLIIPQFLQSSRRQARVWISNFRRYYVNLESNSPTGWNRICSLRGVAHERPPSPFNGSVGFSNFVLRVRGLCSRSLARARGCSANAGFSGLPGFSVRYYMALMDVKSEATARRRVKRRTDENPSLFVSLVTWLSKLGCVDSYYLSLFSSRFSSFVQMKVFSWKKLRIIWKRHMVEFIFYMVEFIILLHQFNNYIIELGIILANLKKIFSVKNHIRTLPQWLCFNYRILISKLLRFL